MTRIKVEIIAGIILFIGGYLVASLTQPANPVLVQDTHPKQEIIIQPSTADEYKAAFESPIVITRALDGADLSISASDGYKRTSVKDRLTFPESTNKTRIYGFSDVAFVDQKFFPTFGCGVDYLFSSLFVGGEVSGGEGRIRAAIKFGITLF